MDEIDYSISGDGSHLVVSYMRSSKALEYLNDNLYDHLTHIIILAEHTSYEVKDDGHILASEALIEIFKPEGLLLTQAIIWYNIGHMKAAEPYLDYINVMIYDNFEANNYHSSYAQFMDFVDNILDKGLPKEKLLAGLPFYGYFALSDWSLKGGTAYSFILEQYNPKIGVDLTFRADGVALSFDGVVKIWKKCAYTLEKDLAGVMMWETWMDIPNFESDSSLMYHVNSVFPVEN